MTGVATRRAVVDVNDDCWTRALTLAERMPARRALRGTAGTVAARDRLRQWREESSLLNGDPIRDPAVLHDCTAADFFAAILLSSYSFGATAAASAGWLYDLADAFRNSDQVSPLKGDAGEWATAFLGLVDRPLAYAVGELRERLRLIDCNGRSRLDVDRFVDNSVAAIAKELAHRIAAPLVLELHEARSRGELVGATPEERFTSFVARLQSQDECVRVLRRYPVLARAIAERLHDWVDGLSEFAARVSDDWPSLIQAFPHLQSDDRVEAADRVGDLHRQGRSVMIVHFRSGASIVYKPRSLAAEARFQELLHWLNAACDIPAFRTLAVVERDGYGWVERVTPGPCGSRDALERFFVRQGGYLALLHLIGGVDFHSENLLAAGEHPVLVDLETLFHGLPGSDAAPWQVWNAIAASATTVLRTGLLPQPILGDEDAVGLDPSGLGGGAVQTLPFKVPQWDRAGTDEMRMILQSQELPAGDNRAFADDAPADVASFAEQLCHGFTRVYETLRAHADALLAPGGQIAAFASAEMRAVLRPTLQYALLLETSFHPTFLGDGLDREQRFDRFFSGTLQWHGRSQVIAAERRDVWRGDVPIFVTRPISKAIWASDGSSIDDFFAFSGMEIAREKLTCGQTARGLRIEQWVIRTALAGSAITSESVPLRPGLGDDAPRLSPDSFIDEATAIASRLEDLAVLGADDATWMTVIAPNATDVTVAPMGLDLYAGVAGPALFLAYLGAVSGDRAVTALARRAARTLVREVGGEVSDVGVGAFMGLGGSVYVLTNLFVLFAEDELLEKARSLVPLIAKRVEQDVQFDFLAGAAGAIRALLVLDAVSPFAPAVAAAVRCGDHLIRTASSVGGGIGWLSEAVHATQPLAGLGHGAAGIAWPLLQLAARTGERRFRDAGEAAVAYERSLFSPEESNWRDVRMLNENRRFAIQLGGATFMHFWCHGSAGIGLARIETLRHWDDGLVMDEIRAALVSTASWGWGVNHSLCHGDFGNLELLLKVPPELATVADDPVTLASRVVAARYDHGWVSGYPTGLESPDLMGGLAGIGYGLLRVAVPDRVPSVLTLDPPCACRT